MKRLFFICALVFLPTLAHAQASVVAAPPGKRQFFTTTNSAGIPLAGGKIYFCSSGSSCPGTPLASYSDSTGNTLNANPIILDAAGMVPSSADVYLLSGSAYKIVAQNSLGATQWTLDNVRANDALSLANTYSQTQTFNGLAVFNGGIGGARILFQQFTASGTFMIPANVTAVKVTVIGAGGGGGGSDAGATFNGSGAGSGGSAVKWLSGLTPGNTLIVTVGTGGIVTSGAAGGNGVASSVASGTQVITTIAANGGGGGGSAAGVLVGGAAAVAGTGGDVNSAGTPAANAAPIATMSNWGGLGAASILGGGGGTVFAGAGVAGTAAGSGGGGAGGGAARAGGAGANGIVIFEWVN